MSDTLTTGDGTRDWARFDVSAVPLQGGYIAKQCPVRAQNDILRPVEPAPVGAALQRRFDAGKRFEVEIAAKVIRDAVVDPAEDREQRVAATIAAMEAGTATIFGGRLPADEIGRRVGEPDILVRDPRPSVNASWSYRPIDVKHHLTLNDDDDAAALCSAPATPRLAEAETVPGVAGRKHKGDLLQLAHYQRMLEASGWAADEGRWGGIIGKEELVVWWDLEEKIWRTPAVTRRSRMRSTMAVYDFEFAFRLDIMAAARLHAQDAAHQLIVVPISNGDCPDCPWRKHCAGLLAADSGDISLLPRLGWTQWKMHRDVTGATRRSQLAGLDWRTARILGAGVDLAALRDLTGPMEDAEPLTAVVANKRKATALAEMGLTTVGDLASLCPTTTLYSGYRTGQMDRHIDEARAALDPAPAFRLRDVDRIEVPRADIEIDIDMENVDEGAYLWGALLTDRSGTGLLSSGYEAFVSWDRSVDAFEANFARFWGWLEAQRRLADDHGLTLKAYCYNAGAENGQMRAQAGDHLAEVDAFLEGPAWVDLLRVVRDHLITGGSLSLKQIAPLAGFSWTVEDPEGTEAMVHYDLAVGSDPAALDSRRWLLEYNRNDVEATLAVRNWLDETDFPSIADLDLVWHPACEHGESK